MLCDLIETEATEEIADVVIFIHREEFYSFENCYKDKTIAEITIAKNKIGPLCTINSLFQSDIAKFFNAYPDTIEF